MAGRFCTERQLCFVFYTDNEAAIVTIQQPLSREVFWHIYAKIPRHTSKNAITEGDFKCIFARNCEVTEQLQFMNKMYAITIYSHGFFISASGEYAVLQRSGEERNSPIVPESTVLPYVPPQRNDCNLQNGHTAVPVRRRWLSAVRSVHKV